MNIPSDILKAKILIVDDQEANVALLEHILAGAGYTSVSSTMDARAVFDLYRKHRHDAILLDLNMPHLNGFKVMEALKEIETEGYLPVLVITAEPAHKVHALRAGAKDFVGKPFDHIEVLIRVQNMLEVRLLNKEIRRLNAALAERAENLEVNNQVQQAALSYVSMFDLLTDLPNRASFLERTGQLLQSHARTGMRLAVVVMDVRHFGRINDSFGKDGGDRMLLLIAERLQNDAHLSCARIGGNTFALTLSDLQSDAEVAQALKKYVLEPLGRAFAIDRHELTIGTCCGIALFPADGEQAEDLVRNAEAALKKAKLRGDEYLFYTSDLNARVVERLALENELHKAIAERQFVLYYQPKYATVSGALVGFEALLRWNSPSRGLVAPFEFIPILEETGMILEVGKWVLQQAAADYRKWRKQGLNPPPIAVNISAIQLRRPDLVETVWASCRGEGEEPAAMAIDLEITESVLMEDIDRIIPSLEKLKNAGYRVSIDDFGTGYSSFSYLAKIPLNTLKIDRTFIRDLTTEPSHKTIVATIILLAHALGLTVVAEGVETEQQRAELQIMGCDEVQGYLLGRPMPAPDAERLQLQRDAV